MNEMISARYDLSSDHLLCLCGTKAVALLHGSSHIQE